MKASSSSSYSVISRIVVIEDPCGYRGSNVVPRVLSDCGRPDPREGSCVQGGAKSCCWSGNRRLLTARKSGKTEPVVCPFPNFPCLGKVDLDMGKRGAVRRQIGESLHTEPRSAEFSRIKL